MKLNIGSPLNQKNRKSENNMLVNFVDSVTNESVAVNLANLVCVFTVKEEGVEKTILNMINGNLAVKENYLEVVGRINAEMK
jgi:uncharacterized hydantoinase/oxoprolinase family protein